MTFTNSTLDSLYVSQLRLVKAVLETGSLSKAAEEVGLSQSAASHALSRMRAELKDPLFTRTPTGMRPTPFGARLAGAVAAALEVLNTSVEQHAEFHPADSGRTFNIMMNDIGQMLYLPGLVRRIKEEAPGISVHVEPAPLTAPHSLLASGKMDLAVGVYTRVVSGCKQRLLHRERYVCVVREDHPLFRDGMSVDAFRSVEHVSADPRGYVHERLDRLLAEFNIVRKVKHTVPFLISLPSVISTSDLLATMSSEVAERFAAVVPLKIMPPPVDLPTYSIRIFWHERFHKDPANVWLRNLYLELFHR